MTDRLTRTRQQIEHRKARIRKLALRAGVVVAGITLGELCPLLPPDWQAPCHLGSKVIAFFLGGG